MKLFKSIKWRLQLWYGMILVIVLAGLGITAYQLQSGQQFGRIDDELHRRIGVLGNALHRHPPHHLGKGLDMDHLPPGEAELGPDEPFPNQPEDHPLPGFHLPPEDARLFDADEPHDFYFKITRFTPHGVIELASSTNYPDHAFTPPSPPPDRQPGSAFNSDHALRPSPPPVEMFSHYREIVQVMPSGEIVQIGCSIAPELHALEMSALKLTAAGGVILLLGLAGGWWFVGRALRPISDISSTATKISGGNLSERINVAEADSELGQLANVLNSTFARLEAAFAQQKQFASDAAHELRTPVTVILTQTQMALGRERDTAAYKQTVEACERAAQRMRKLIESLLSLARLDAGQEVLNRLPFDLAKSVEDSVNLITPLALEQGIQITTELQPVEINGDAERLAQVTTNLLANAIQYNKLNGEVHVKVCQEQGLAILTISDSGKGIPSADLPRVFERFYRADASRTGAGNAGLGLAICKAIVTAHAGTIEVASRENFGTKFTVRLPLK